MWSRFAEYVARHRISLVFEMTFHVELESLPDDYLMTQLAGSCGFFLPLPPSFERDLGRHRKPVDYGRASAHLNKYRVRVASDQLQELLAGYRDPHRGFTYAIEGGVVRVGDAVGHNLFLDTLSFAACSFWSCDAPRAITRKARDFRRQLVGAVKQLPPAGNAPFIWDSRHWTALWSRTLDCAASCSPWSASTPSART